MPEEPISAEEVAHRRFSYAFRGFDAGEVRDYLNRLAEELRTAGKRERELQRQVADAEYRATHPVVDEAVLTRSLGEETSRVLASAHEVASELQAKAEDNAARILREAHVEAQRIRASAEVVLVERTEEAEAAADEIRRAARDETETLLQQARNEAASVLSGAEAKSARMVSDAETASARVLSELARRRRVASAQIEQLRAGRERLLEAYKVVRRTLDEVVDELHRAEPEARQAAEAAARRAGIDPTQEEDVEADVTEVEEAAPGVSVKAATAQSLLGTGTGTTDPSVEPEAVSEPPPLTVDQPQVEAGTDEESAAGEPGPDPVPDETLEVPVAAPGEGEAQLASLAPAHPQDREPPAAGDVAAEERPAVPEATVPSAPEPEAETEKVESPDGEPERVGAPAGVSELFARIKADRAAAVARAQNVLASDDASAEQVGTPAAAEARAEQAPTEGPSPDGDEVLLQRRDDALEDIVSGLARRLKRVLQDEQNEVLDRLRSHRGRAPLELLPSSDDQAARYRLAGADLLQEAASAGAEFIAPGTAVTPDIGDLADGLAASLAGPLRRRLQQGMRPEDGDDPAAVAESVGAAYREWKAQRIDRLAGDAAISAFSRGTSAAAPGARLRWVVDDDDGPCPDCDDNALAGPTPVGEAYPTGQRHPPAHAGCRCLPVPTST